MGVKVKVDDMYKYLLIAFEEAEIAKAEGTFPIGAVLVDSNGTVIAADGANDDIYRYSSGAAS